MAEAAGEADLSVLLGSVVQRVVLAAGRVVLKLERERQGEIAQVHLEGRLTFASGGRDCRYDPVRCQGDAPFHALIGARIDAIELRPRDALELRFAQGDRLVCAALGAAGFGLVSVYDGRALFLLPLI